ncbi:MAG: 16S rRNA (uracil(1498)-N(3))-methyltransferase [Candidatus Omnitrophica bacterium]|nr:16S rRNA (uracil(1498)-N(3))-methyltransferase [Candidatus Omnitrophota bacterium]MBU1872025.1 16S rRNA (uracil(1498)-N(3))-methyltransferase [Candidatus Omnitrophota bacterium]
MNRVFCPKEWFIKDYVIILDRKQIHYLCDVLRIKLNEDIVVFDGSGNEYRCLSEELSKNKIKLLIKEKAKMKTKRKIILSIACALPKQKGRFDDLIDKLSQLGVERIIPLFTERVILRWDAKQKDKHHQRWCKIARAACNQSGRTVLPVIEPVKSFTELIAEADSYDLKLIPTIIQKKHSLRDALSGLEQAKMLVAIGPEGDFCDKELALAERAGFKPVSLGELVLRVDTAAVSVAAFVRLNEK